ncbi:MAG: helicase-associated domain-containing protein [Planctomycetota bacterium]|nr:helicase-associated domain-containing protein [Planctomycetota bacterium]
MSRSKSNGSGSFKAPKLAEELAKKSKNELSEMHVFWLPGAEQVPTTVQALRKELAEAMVQGERIRDRLAALGARMSAVFHVVLQGDGHQIRWDALGANPALDSLSQYDLEAALMMLERHGMLVAGGPRSALDSNARSVAIPSDLAQSLVRQLAAVKDGVYGRLTLRGYLERMYSDPARSKRTPPSRVREMFRMYVGEAASVSRIERLPEGLRDLVEKAILEFGGILPKPLFERMETELPEWDASGWAKALGESLVGTVSELDLRPYGVAHSGPTLIVFSEVALAWFRRVAVPGDPDRPYREDSQGVNTLSNLSRFLAFVQSNSVRITKRGEMFKSTWKRIEENFLPDPQHEITMGDSVRLIYRFARNENLIDTSAERTLRIASAGRAWGATGMAPKLERLLEFMVHEPLDEALGEHDLPLRRTLMRMLHHLEPGVWYDLMYLPFLARNQHLCNLDDWQEGQGHSRSMQGGRSKGGGDLQRLAWSLVAWLRQRLFPVGLLDLGYDSNGHAVAMRLTRLGTLALGMEAAPSPGMGRGSLVVTPDFEVVFFPGEDDAQMVYDLDRFADRAPTGTLKQYRLNEAALKRGLLGGMELHRMRDCLEMHSRTPIPENVYIALSDWALRAGLFFLSDKLVIRCQHAEYFERFVSDAGVRPYLKAQVDETSAQMKRGPSPKRLRTVLRDLDYLVEIE